MTAELLPREEKEDREPLLVPEDRGPPKEDGWDVWGLGGRVESTLRM